MGRSCASQRAWILVVRPPRERPIACSCAPLFRPPPSGVPWRWWSRAPGSRRRARPGAAPRTGAARCAELAGDDRDPAHPARDARRARACSFLSPSSQTRQTRPCWWNSSARPILRFTDLDEAIAAANASENGLGGSIWTKDIDRARRIARSLECGSVWINRHGAIPPKAPFGGVKKSGLGVGFGEEGCTRTPASRSCSAEPRRSRGIRGSGAPALDQAAARAAALAAI